jgi:hemoglobin
MRCMLPRMIAEVISAPASVVTEDAIVRLVNDFYTRVRRDPELGPVFDRAIPTEAWPAHLEKMYAFWSSVMLTSGRYKGNPVAVHQRVTGIESPLFSRWLDLFEATAHSLFVPETAEIFVLKARRIAESLKLALFFRADAPWPDDLRKRSAGAAAQAAGS